MQHTKYKICLVGESTACPKKESPFSADSELQIFNAGQSE